MRISTRASTRWKRSTRRCAECDIPAKGAPATPSWRRCARASRATATGGTVAWPSISTGCDEELERVQQQAYLAYWTENNLGQRAFPSLKSLEDEVIAMALSLLGGGERAGGTFTSGGSESIFLAMMAAREQARAQRGVTRAQHRAAEFSAHLTFDRAAEALGMEVAARAGRRRPARRCRGDGSAHGWRHRRAGRLRAQLPLRHLRPDRATSPRWRRERGAWMHVDACVGGFLAPYVRRLGHDVPAFELSACRA